MFKELFCSHLIFFFYQICRYYALKRLLKDVSEREKKPRSEKKTFAFESTVASRRNSILLFEEELFPFFSFLLFSINNPSRNSQTRLIPSSWSSIDPKKSAYRDANSRWVSPFRVGRRARRRKLIPDEWGSRQETQLRKPSADSKLMTYILF